MKKDSLDLLCKNLNALFILTLSGVLLAAYSVQFLKHEQPCPLCMLQRLGMIGVASGLLLNLKFGIRPIHYGLSLLSAIFGGGVALRQICLHICPGDPKFGKPILDLSLYTWSFITFSCSIFVIALLLFLYRSQTEPTSSVKMNILAKFSFAIIFLITLGNMVTTLLECGLSSCAG